MFGNTLCFCEVWHVDRFRLLMRDESAFYGCAITATVVGMLNSLFIAIVIIPSYLAQTLKLRYGLTPTLRDDSDFFLNLRHTVESVCVLFPACVSTPYIYFYHASLVFHLWMKYLM